MKVEELAPFFRIEQEIIDSMRSRPQYDEAAIIRQIEDGRAIYELSDEEKAVISDEFEHREARASRHRPFRIGHLVKFVGRLGYPFTPIRRAIAYYLREKYGYEHPGDDWELEAKVQRTMKTLESEFMSALAEISDAATGS